MATPNRKAAGPKRNGDDTLIGLFLDMLAAEQGSGANTIEAYLCNAIRLLFPVVSPGNR